MKTLPTIFISYNPNSEIEETLAIRLHTIGMVHGFTMLLPDRDSNMFHVSNETRNRILMSNYFIMFSTKKLSPTVQNEIKMAYEKFKNKSKILIVYDKQKGKNLKGADNCTEIYIDSKTQSAQEVVNNIINEIKKHQKNTRKVKIRPAKKSHESSDVLGGILLAGIGLILLGALVNSKK